jgi:catechol 2,3-dioxygenase-like lactoylglutathione lyase family enzyme
MQLKTMMLFVTDLAGAEHFYCRILGFRLKSKDENRLSFAQEEEESGEFIAFKCGKNAVIEDYGNAARPVFVFAVDSLDQRFRELQAKGVVFLHQEPAEKDFCRYAAF